MKLAKYISESTLKDLNENLIIKAKESLIDTIGVSMGACKDFEINNIYNNLLACHENGPSTVWGKPVKTSLFIAALINGMMGHVLELDDVHKRSKCHAGTVVIPTALVAGEFSGSSGNEVLEAIILGYETMVRVGMGFGVSSHRLKGWHVTSTAGTFGTAATASKLLGLKYEQVLSALGIAGTQSSGLWAFTADGATSKKFHPGHAASCGIMAAVLAKSGMIGPSRILDADDGGLFPAMSDSYDYSIIEKDLGVTFEFTDIDRKPYACCRSIHPPINAVLNIKNRENLNIDDVDHINVKTYKIAIIQCGHTVEPKNIFEARFSMAYGMAVALIDGMALPEQFSETRIKDEKVLFLARKISIYEDKVFSDMYPTKWGCEVEVFTKSGKKFIERMENAKGDPLNPLTTTELKDKYLSLVSPVTGMEKAQIILDNLLHIEDVDNISYITRLLSI